MLDRETWSTWSWSAVINLTPRAAGELRSAPSGPDARGRVAGKLFVTLRHISLLPPPERGSLAAVLDLHTWGSDLDQSS